MLHDFKMSGTICCFLIWFIIFNIAIFRSIPALIGLNNSFASPRGSRDLLFFNCFRAISKSSMVQSGVVFACASLSRSSNKFSCFDLSSCKYKEFCLKCMLNKKCASYIFYQIQIQAGGQVLTTELLCFIL